eukprot:15103184-Ditylum_brightwellii.AAC.1
MKNPTISTIGTRWKQTQTTISAVERWKAETICTVFTTINNFALLSSHGVSMELLGHTQSPTLTFLGSTYAYLQKRK